MVGEISVFRPKTSLCHSRHSLHHGDISNPSLSFLSSCHQKTLLFILSLFLPSASSPLKSEIYPHTLITDVRSFLNGISTFLETYPTLTSPSPHQPFISLLKDLAIHYELNYPDFIRNLTGYSSSSSIAASSSVHSTPSSDQSEATSIPSSNLSNP